MSSWKNIYSIELIVFCGTNYKLPGERGWFIPTTFGVWNGLCNWFYHRLQSLQSVGACNTDRIVPKVFAFDCHDFLIPFPCNDAVQPVCTVRTGKIFLHRSSDQSIPPPKKNMGELFSEQENRKHNPNKILDLAIILLSFAVSKYIFMCIYIYT